MRQNSTTKFRYVAIFFAMGAGIWLFTSIARAEGDLNQRIALENALNTQLTSELQSVLPEKSFAVFSSVETSMRRVRIVSEGEVLIDEHSKQKKETPTPAVDLPGFNAIAIAENDQESQNSQKERQVYREVEQLEVDKVSVRVLLEKTLPDDLKVVARSTVTQRLQASFAGKATVAFQDAPLMSADAMARRSIGGPLNFQVLWAFATDNLWTILGIILGSMAFLALLGALTRRRESRLREPHEPGIVEPTETIDVPSFPHYSPNLSLAPAQNPYGSNFTQGQVWPPRALPQARNPISDEVGAESQFLSPELPTLEIAVEAFVEEVSRDPILARNFLCSLDVKSRTMLYSCFETSTLKDTLGRMMEQGGKSGTPPAEAAPDVTVPPGNVIEVRRNTLSHITAEMQQYKKLMHLQLRQRFGFLCPLAAGELQRLLEGKDALSLFIIMRHLPKQVSAKVVKSLSPEVRMELVAQLSSPTVIPDDAIAQVESELKEEVSRLANGLFVPYSDSETLLDTIVEESDDAADIVGVLQKKNVKLFEKYRQHMISFEDLLQMPAARWTALLDKVTNETLAMALCNLPSGQSATVLEGLPPLRRKVVSSLAVSLGRTKSVDDVAQARKDLLRTMRSVGFDAQPAGATL